MIGINFQISLLNFASFILIIFAAEQRIKLS